MTTPAKPSAATLAFLDLVAADRIRFTYGIGRSYHGAGAHWSKLDDNGNFTRIPRTIPEGAARDLFSLGETNNRNVARAVLRPAGHAARATRFKVYDMGRNGIPSRLALDLIGAAQHVQQARVYLVAATRKDAIALAEARGLGRYRGAFGDLRPAMGNYVNALANAGVIDHPTVYVMPKTTMHTSKVAELTPLGTCLAGQFAEGEFDATLRQRPIIFTPAAAITAPREG